MRYRRFGQTNRNLSVFSLGTMRYLASEETAYRVIQAATSRGINHVETARGYGKSEHYLGTALRAGLLLPRSRFFITSKIVPLADADEMDRAIDQSLATLGLDYLDGLALHGVNTWEHLARIEAATGCMAAVWRAVDDGRVRHVGFSTHAPLEIILRAIATDQFAFINLHYYLFFQRHQPALELAHAKDMGIFIISPADKGGMLYTPPPALAQLCAPLSPLALNYRFLLSDRRVTTLSVGPAVPEELDQPLAEADWEGNLTDVELAALERLDRQQAQTLGTDQCHQCYACLPCPEHIHIPEVLRLRNLAAAYDMTEFGRYRYGMFENAGHWFPGRRGDRCTECGDCLPRCPSNLNIPALLADAHDRLKGRDRRRLWDE
ncbi:MAG: aldo/keto reductase [Elainellaceae cyanobacterium]